ncbi:hypothetical protein [Methanococcus maripaludis]|uniref:Serine acetyltransferase n=1 Tax=Methanococcus maripaludis TaxID=39152 RepID=A0A7J9PAV0_METMI|nr:hypothetical protein [Methanococcus maripaludis]MBA2859846.1 serine acetyltransferase [Methanococcus maripaludis]
MKNLIYKILTLNPRVWLKIIPKKGNNAISRIVYHIMRSLTQIILSGEYPSSEKIKCKFSHHVGIVLAETEIGENTVLRQNTTIGRNPKSNQVPKIGAGCDFGTNCNIIGKTEIANNVTIGAGCNIAESKIEKNTKIGMGCTIVHSKVGKNCKILSGVVLYKQEIPDNSIVNPVTSNICVIAR